MSDAGRTVASALSIGARVSSMNITNSPMASRVFVVNIACTSVCRIALKTEQFRSWLAPSNRSIVTSLRPRAGTFAMRSRLMSSCGFTNVFR